MGAPKGNLNAARNGSRIARLTLGNLPPSMLQIQRGSRVYRRELEDLAVEARGEVNLFDAHLIDEAATAECHASVCRWLLRERLDKMTPADIRQTSAEIVKAKTQRNAAVRRLRLDDRAKTADYIDTLYSEDEPDERAEDS
jgi:hypothetical protein